MIFFALEVFVFSAFIFFYGWSSDINHGDLVESESAIRLKAYNI